MAFVTPAYPAKGFLPETVIGTGRFRPNGTSNPSSVYFGGSLKGLFTVTYGATGLYTATFTPKGFKFPASRPPTILVGSTCADTTDTNRFQVSLIGDWNNTTRSFVIGSWQSNADSAAFAPPSDVGNWISFILVGVPTTAKR